VGWIVHIIVIFVPPSCRILSKRLKTGRWEFKRLASIAGDAFCGSSVRLSWGWSHENVFKNLIELLGHKRLIMRTSMVTL
jgi:hypothetical protein